MVHFNYFFDGPCGDCPFNFSPDKCDTETCIHYLAWEFVYWYVIEQGKIEGGE